MQELSNEIASKYEEIIKEIKSFSDKYLNKEYEKIYVMAAKELCLNNKEHLKKGKSVSWAAGIVHALGSINSLFDSSEEPYIKALELYKEFGVSSSTGASKSKEIKNLLGLSEDNEKWIIKKSNVDLGSKSEVALTAENSFKDNERSYIDKQPFKVHIDKQFVLAQRIVDYAWKQKNYNKKAKYAKEALSVYENCADAYIILSRDSSLNSIQKKELLKKAVEVGIKALNINDLESAPKDVFNLRASDPLFGAKYTLANQLWEMNERDEAIKNASEILKYKKEDTLMVRGLLANWLLMEKRYEELKELLEKYDNDYLVAINYSKILYLYKSGNIKAAENAFRKAYKKNPYVIPYILKQKTISNTEAHNMKLGGEEEAINYARTGLELWNDSEILKWVKDTKSNFDILNNY